MEDSLPLVSETYDEEEGGITGDSYGSFKNPVLISDSSDELTPTGSFSSMDPNKMARDAIGDVGVCETEWGESNAAWPNGSPRVVFNVTNNSADSSDYEFEISIVDSQGEIRESVFGRLDHLRPQETATVFLNSLVFSGFVKSEYIDSDGTFLKPLEDVRKEWESFSCTPYLALRSASWYPTLDVDYSQSSCSTDSDPSENWFELTFETLNSSATDASLLIFAALFRGGVRISGNSMDFFGETSSTEPGQLGSTRGSYFDFLPEGGNLISDGDLSCEALYVVYIPEPETTPIGSWASKEHKSVSVKSDVTECEVKVLDIGADRLGGVEYGDDTIAMEITGEVTNSGEEAMDYSIHIEIFDEQGDLMTNFYLYELESLRRGETAKFSDILFYWSPDSDRDDRSPTYCAPTEASLAYTPAVPIFETGTDFGECLILEDPSSDFDSLEVRVKNQAASEKTVDVIVALMSDGVRVDDFPVWADNIPAGEFGTGLRDFLEGALDGMTCEILYTLKFEPFD